MRIELLRPPMNRSHYDCAPFQCDADFAQTYIIRKMESEAKAPFKPSSGVLQRS
jgi:hypothetical protein